jgi:hypothetical protein
MLADLDRDIELREHREARLPHHRTTT